MIKPILELYERHILRQPFWILLSVFLTSLFFGFHLDDFELDASAESLILEGDKDLKFFRDVVTRYGSNEFLILTYTPDTELFSDESLNKLTQLRDELKAIEGVESVVTVMDVPLLSNPPVPLEELVSNIKTLENPSTDIALAKEELANSPLYVNMLLNLEHNTTALQINLPINDINNQLISTRDALYLEERTPSIEKQIIDITQLIKANNATRAQEIHELIGQVRDHIKPYQDRAEIHLGGVPMVADDIMSFVKSDLVNFGFGVLLFLILTLWLIFRSLRWVLIPLLSCFVVVEMMLGILGTFSWQVTVISSNFISLLLILTLSMTIHLIVRYRELVKKEPDMDQVKLVRATVKQVFIPCFYMALTTAVAFTSLVVSDIRPVINFGWMMTAGILVAFMVTFTLFPAILVLLGKREEIDNSNDHNQFTSFLAGLTKNHSSKLTLGALVMAAATVIGISKLVVENSFIDYFGKSTEIYQGMSVIDQRLGGTTPLEVVINFEEDTTFSVLYNKSEDDVNESLMDNSFIDEDEFLDEDLLEFGDIGGFEDDFVNDVDPEKYWFTADKVSKIKSVHNYLDELEATGKVVSLATMIEIAEGFNDGRSFDDLQLALLYSVIPEDFRALVIRPYVSVQDNQARINVRIVDSAPGLKRGELLDQIEYDMVHKLGFSEEDFELSGMMVLYNNLLQSLFGSQISTIAAVFGGILIMFLILFRSIKISLIAMLPNMLAAGFVLGLMGWLSIPLDMMTITIASITIGIAVDNTIHYIVRYRYEFNKDRNYSASLDRSHASIGKAMFYTSITIIIGFSILVLSNFKPTIYFGLLTALAMLVALIGSLTLLPHLLGRFKALD